MNGIEHSGQTPGAGHANEPHPEPHLVTVYLDGEPREIRPGGYTTEELIAVLKVPAGYLLNLANERGHLETLKPGQHVGVHKGLKFYTQVPCGGSA